MTDINDIKKIISETYDGNINNLDIQTIQFKDGKEVKQETKQNVPGLFVELQDCIKTIENTDYAVVNRFLNECCSEEKQELVERFKAEFENVPVNDKLRVETLHFLAKLGIKVGDL